MPSIPSLFQAIPENLMTPLSSPLKETYWQALVIAFRFHQRSTPGETTREELLEELADHLGQVSLATGLTDDAEPQDPRAFAARIVKQLREWGWLRFEYQAGSGSVLRMPDYASRLMAVLEDTARAEQPRIRGCAYNLQQILTDRDLQIRDPAFVLYQARETVQELLRELYRLRSNVGQYVDRVAERTEVKELLALQFDDYWPEVMESRYQNVKTTDNLFRFRFEILNRIRELSLDPLFVQEAAATVERRESTPADDAKALVYDWLDEIRTAIENLDHIVAEIDARHAHYVRLTHQRIRHQLQRDESTENRLIGLIQHLHATPESRLESGDDLMEMYRLRVLGEDSLYTSPQQHESHESDPIAHESISPDETQELLSRFRSGFFNPVSRERVYAEIQERLSTSNAVLLSELPIHDDTEFLRIVAIHAYTAEESSPFELSPHETPTLTRTGAYAFRDATLSARSEQPATTSAVSE